MRELTEALTMDITEIAQAVGVTARTVKTWIAGTRKPAERNRIKLARLVSIAHREHSSAEGRRWSQRRDALLSAAKLALMSADERAIWERDGERLRAQFATPATAAPAKPKPSFAAMRDGFAAANERYNAERAGQLTLI